MRLISYKPDAARWLTDVAELELVLRGQDEAEKGRGADAPDRI